MKKMRGATPLGPLTSAAVAPRGEFGLEQDGSGGSRRGRLARRKRRDASKRGVGGADLPVGEAYALVVGTHCGVRVLNPVNDTLWITDEATQPGDWMPAEWAEAIEGGQELIVLEVVLSDSDTNLTATAEGVSVRYRPVAEDDEVTGCA